MLSVEATPPKPQTWETDETDELPNFCMTLSTCRNALVRCAPPNCYWHLYTHIVPLQLRQYSFLLLHCWLAAAESPTRIALCNRWTFLRLSFILRYCTTCTTNLADDPRRTTLSLPRLLSSAALDIVAPSRQWHHTWVSVGAD